MSSYFVLDYEICKHAREKYNAFISPTGRGSAGSFYVNMLLGLTELDRHISPVILYPTRFMSTERILSSKSLPDIDINCSNQEDLVKASEDILGKEYCGWMVSFKLLKESSAFRLWCKAKGLEQSEYNEFAKHIRECVEKGDYSYKDDPKWKDLVKESEVFVGVIESISPSPCSILLSTEPVAKHIGYIKINDKICCNLDGYNCDKYKYLKNDYLNVTVYKIVQDTCKLAGIDIPNIEQLTGLLDDKVWDIYEKGLTCTINQADSNYATPLIMRYKPKSVEEVCAFVAAIRPGFASLLQNFLDRKTYSTGVKELDDLLEDSFHYMLYQESIMKYLIWLGMDESETYTIIKKISKKKFKEEELSELKRKLQAGWRKKVGRDEGFEETWKVVEDAAHYSFNASHSLAYAYDSIYGAYLKSHYPLEYYSATFNLYEDDLERTPKLVSELDYFGIKLEKARFGYSKSKYFFDRESKTIYKGIKSIKYMNEDIGNFLYDIKDNVKDFLDFLIKSKGVLDKRQIEILIKLDFFREFGEINYLLKIYDIYKKYSEIKQLKKENLDIPIEVARKYCEKETSKLLKEVDNIGLINELIKAINCAEVTTKEKLEDEFEFTGGILPQKDADIQFCMVSDVKEFNTLRVDFIHVRTGERYSVKAKKWFSKQIEKGKVIKITEFEKKPKPVLVDEKWTNSKSETELWIKSIEKID